MSFTLVKNAMKDPDTRQGYNMLAKATFRLDFAPWYNSGYFDGSHIPYTVFDGDKAVANISANVMYVEYDGKIRKYVQLGTVMTDPEYRGKGLQKFIFREIEKDFTDADAIILFANRNVLDFYPKLGFEKAVEYIFEKTVTGRGGTVKQLDMAGVADVALFKKYYDMGNPFSALSVTQGFALEMFYLGGPYADCVYYIPSADAVVVAEKDGDRLTVLEILCKDADMDSVLATLCDGETKVQLGFTPRDTDSWNIQPLCDDDTTLFVYSKGENIFASGRLLFPLIAHT